MLDKIEKKLWQFNESHSEKTVGLFYSVIGFIIGQILMAAPIVLYRIMQY